MRNKICSLSEAVARVPNNAVVALGGNAPRARQRSSAAKCKAQRPNGDCTEG